MTLNINWEDVVDLGKVSDREVARRLTKSLGRRVSHDAVRKHRIKLGIEKFSETAHRVSEQVKKIEDDPDLGVKSDATVGKKYGLSHQRIQQIRKRRDQRKASESNT